MYGKPRLLIQCVYGIMYIVLGNIGGNAIAFGIYITIAANKNPEDKKGWVYGIAISALTFCALTHIFSKRGGIRLSNAFGAYKIILLATITILGWVYAGDKFLHQNKPKYDSLPQDYNFRDPFHFVNGTTDGSSVGSIGNDGETPDFSSIVNAILGCLFSFTGFEQPFYVLSEVKNPRRNFPKAILSAVYTTIVFYMAVNISYMLVVYVDDAYTSNTELDIVGKMFETLFTDSRPDQAVGYSAARRAAAGVIALSILGNVLVMTFTAARVKQEIAKEGFIPFSLFFGSGYTTPWARFKQRRERRAQTTNGIQINDVDIDDPLEQSPIPALILHWFSSVVLVAVFAWPDKPSTAYTILISLYSYTNVCVIGLFVSFGLLYLKVTSLFIKDEDKKWSSKTQWMPYLDPLPNIIFFLTTSFLVIGAFVPVTFKKSPFYWSVAQYPTWLIAIIGITSLLWGTVWWGGLKLYERNTKKTLDVKRIPYLVQDDDMNWIQKVELVIQNWVPILRFREFPAA